MQVTKVIKKAIYWGHLPAALAFLILSFVILGPLLHRGYLLHYDMVFAPHFFVRWDLIRNKEALLNEVPFVFVLNALSFILPGDILQKLTLAFIFFFSGFSMYLTAPVKNKFAKFFAGFFYVVNPFVYDRFMAGHCLFLIAYALTPLAIYFFLRFYREPNQRNGVLVALMWTLCSIFSIHHFIILGIAFFVTGVFYIRNIRALAWTAGVILALFALNIWWLWPILASPQVLGYFGISHFYAFATRPDPQFGLFMNMLGMYGFWHKGWVLAKDFIPFWPFVWLIIIIPVLAGIGSLSVQTAAHRRVIFSLMAVSVVSLFMAAGPSQYTSGLNSWLFTNLPGFSALRESQKVLSLLIFAYAFIGSVGLEIILSGKSKRLQAGILGAFLLLTSFYAFPLFTQGNGQLKTTDYPKSWYRLAQTQAGKEKILVLPWEEYIQDSFFDKLTANPAVAFFGLNAIQSTDMKMKGVDTREKDETSRIVLATLDSKKPETWAKSLQKIGVKTILVLKTKKKRDYSFLLADKRFKLVDKDDFTTVISFTE